MRTSIPRSPAALSALLALALVGCFEERTAPPPVALKVHVEATRADALLMVRTPSAPLGEREGNTVDLEARLLNPQRHELEHKKDVVWWSSNDEVATVDSTGLVTAQGVGEARIFVEHKKSLDSVLVRVIPVPVRTVTVSGPDSISLHDTVSFIAATLDSAGQPLIGRAAVWHSTDGTVASVDQSGQVIALKVGTISIDATSEGKSGAAPLRVWRQPVATVQVAPAAVSMPLFESATLAATLRDRHGNTLSDRTIAWSSSATEVFTVGASGVTTTVASVSPGTGAATATSEHQSGSATVEITNPVEARALWVNRIEYSNFSSVNPARIRTIVQRAASANFNIIYFQVRVAGDAYYASTIEPCATRLCGTLGGPRTIDPLAIAIEEANKYGIQVHAWLNALTGWVAGSTFVCGQLADPVTPRHMTKEHPTWNMLLANGTQQPCATTAEYTWVSPGHPGVRTRLARVAADIARRYDVKGVHLDRIRYPTLALSYDTASVNEYKRQNNGAAPVANSAAWASFRRGFVNAAVKEVHDSLMAVNPNLVLSAAIWPIYKQVKDWVSSKGFNDYLQDPRAWATGGYLDVGVPMTYSSRRVDITPTYEVRDVLCDPLDWTCLLDDHRLAIESGAGRHVYIGVGAIKGWTEVQKQMEKGRGRKATGYSFYSYSQVDTLLFAPGQPAGAGWTLLKNSYFKYPAVVPAMPWK